jgi:23S rRNA (cytosine1962-C5)-methyltransferase
VIPVRLKKGKEAPVAKGYPWIFASDIIDSSEWRLTAAGSLVSVENHKGERLGIGYVNPASQIACRVLTLANETIDALFFKRRLERAMVFRQKHIDVPYYRLVHSEADGLPGLLIDRFGGTYVVQVGTAGMDALKPLWAMAMESLLQPEAIVLRNDASARELEKLPREVQVMKGAVPELVEVLENGFVYYADLLKGQKTGWFYDQRDNHKMVAERAKGKTVLDMYAHSGGFGLLAAKMGAKEVTLVDSSSLALELAKKAADKNGVGATYKRGDAFELMEKLAGEGKRYDIVIADPPPFVKTKKDIAAGLKGYAKMAKLAAALVAPGGHMFAASCSHHASRGAFAKAVMDGTGKAGREAQVVKQTGAAPDHPRHLLLPQSEYLKGILLHIAS